MLMCFRADILLEIPRVHVSKKVQVSRPSLGRGMVPSVGMDPGEYCTWGFCNLTVNFGMRIGPVTGLSTRRKKRLPQMVR